MTSETTASSISVTVVIPALNSAGTLSSQLEALDRQTYLGAFDVIVVDNGSDDTTAADAAAFPATRYTVRLVTEPRRGINLARNAGVSAAPDGMVFLCDADDQVHPRWLEAMSDALVPGVWVGGALDYLTLNTAHTRVVWDAPEQSVAHASEPYVDRTYGCNCGFWRSMWEAIGGFDETLSGTGGDENEMFMRAYGAGYRFRDVPAGLVSYRLRPGARLMARQRYRQGKNQIKMRRLAGGRLLPEQHTIRSSSRDLLRTLAAAPKYAVSRRRGYQWLGATSRHLGRLVALCRPGR